MPGVIMADSEHHGSLSNHDRQPELSGTDPVANANERIQEKRKGSYGHEPEISPEIKQPTMESLNIDRPAPEVQVSQDRPRDIPPEVEHISAGFVSFGSFITRLAQQTHHRLTNTISELAQMPAPSSMVNGNGLVSSVSEDASPENVAKKVKLLQFAQTVHAEWVKALVLNNWSRKAGDVSKIIDLKNHLHSQETLYNEVIEGMSMVKLNLHHARMPNPDLKTALEVLTSGKASWMPDLNYIPRPPLTDEQVLKALRKLNTLLSIRLNLHDHDKIPKAMRDFTIQSGRVTFRVAGEFELDLTIGNEDPTSQFWFIDFRFAFEPSIAALPSRMLALIENKINLILGTVGLDECYRFLHEFVQTHKISEIREQAIGLSKGRWIGGLEVEQLNRSLSIQYWAGRNPKGPKSFILLGVHSGKHGDDNGQPRLESHLSIRWFRDGREMVDLISFDGNPVSAEELLKGVIARHVGHILQSTYDELRKRPIFANHEAAVSVCISANEPAASQLMVQMSHREHLTMNIDQVSGDLIFSPASRLNSEAQHRLNTRCNDPASEAFQHIENLRCLSIVEEVALCGQSVGWVRQRPPALRPEDIKAVLPRDTLQVAWFRRQGWRQEWSVVISVGMSGQRWFLIQTTAIPISINYPSGLKVSAHLHIPIKTQTPTASYAFMSALAVFAAGLVSQYTNLRMLHARRILRQLRRPHQPGPINLPSIYLRMSSIVSIKSPRSTKPWAHDFVKFSFQGLHYLEQLEATSDASSISREQAIIIAEARIVTPLPMAFAKLSRKVDRDIAYNDKTGCFAFRLLCDVGDSIVSLLVERLKSVHRLMELVEVLRRHEATLDCESISLGQICFSYRMDGATQSNDSYRAVIDLSRPSTPMRLELLAGNPHIRVLDSLSRILNSSEGLDGVAILLPITLPVLRAFESIETRWSEEAMLDKGEVLVSVRAIDNYVLRYKIRRSPSDSDAVQVGFQLRLMEKKGKAFWYMRRQVNASRPADELDDRLSQSVWAAHDKDWNPVTQGAIAIGNGAEQALDAIDQVMRSVAEDPTITIEPGRKAMHSSADALQSQQRSMPAPNVQSQQQPPQPQPRGMKREREVVEID